MKCLKNSVNYILFYKHFTISDEKKDKKIVDLQFYLGEVVLLLSLFFNNLKLNIKPKYNAFHRIRYKKMKQFI